MGRSPTTLERAFELAKSGTYKSIDEIKARLKREGFDPAQVSGRTLFSQLRNEIKQAEEAPAGS